MEVVVVLVPLPEERMVEHDSVEAHPTMEEEEEEEEVGGGYGQIRAAGH